MPRLLLLAALALSFPTVAQAQSASFERLTLFGGPAQGIGTSEDGRYVVGTSAPPVGGGTAAYRWVDGSAQRLVAATSFATAVSADGLVVVGYNSTTRNAFRWTASDGVQILGTGDAVAVSADGMVVVGTTAFGQGGVDTYRWTAAAGMQPLGALPGGNVYSRAADASASGNAIVGTLSGATSNNMEAFLWTPSTGVVGLGFLPPDARSEAFGVSPDGQVVVGRTSGFNRPFRAFRWSISQGMQALGVPTNGFNGQARAASLNGEVVIGFAERFSVTQGTYWTAERGMLWLDEELVRHGLDLTGLTQLFPADISEDGQVIIGTAYDSAGRRVAWRAVLPRENTDIVVTTTGDEPNDPASAADDECDVDRDTEDSQCTLRAALELANARDGGRITFEIPGDGVPTISVGEDALPILRNPITIDGTTQPGGWVELSGGIADGFVNFGVEIGSGATGSEVRGLVINGFSLDVVARADECVIEGNRIGTDATGTQATWHPEREVGVTVTGNGTRLAGNVMAGHWGPSLGIEVIVDGGDGTVFEGNRIGVGADGRVVPGGPTGVDTYYTGIVILGDGAVVGGGAALPGDACTSPCNLIAGVETAVALGDYPPLQYYELVVGANVSGNWFGVDATGAPDFSGGSETSGVRDGSAARGSVISHNLIHVSGTAVGADSGAVVLGNVLLGREGGSGHLATTGHVIVEGPGAEVRGNTIRSYSSRGVVVTHDVSTGVGENTIIQNTITDNPLGGVLVLDGTGHIVVDNDIHDNSLYGINVLSSIFGRNRAPSAVISQNRIYNNDIGIDIGSATGEIVDVPPYGWAVLGDGVTINDASDGDNGPNGLLNFPVGLSSTYDGTTLAIQGFIPAPLLSTADYIIEAFTSPACSSSGASMFGAQRYGAGEHYVGTGGGTASFGDVDFALALTDVPAGDAYVSLTATRPDLGATSEFSRCFPLVSPDQTAQASVATGQSGLVLDAQGTTVVIAASVAGATARGVAAQHDGGTLYVTRYEGRPDVSVFADSTASAPSGAQIRPESVAERYWLLADRGLTQAGGAPGDTPTFDVCLGAEGTVFPGSLESVVVVQRDEATAGLWEPRATTLKDHGGESYLCATGLTSLGEMGLGGSKASFPVSAESDDGLGASSSVLTLRAFPNPASGFLSVEGAVPRASTARVTVHDALGRHVALLHDGSLAAGPHAFSLDTAGLAPGLYIVRLTTPDGTATRRMTVVR